MVLRHGGPWKVASLRMRMSRAVGAKGCALDGGALASPNLRPGAAAALLRGLEELASGRKPSLSFEFRPCVRSESRAYARRHDKLILKATPEREDRTCRGPKRGVEYKTRCPARPNVRVNRPAEAGRLGPVGENVLRTADRAKVPCRSWSG